MASPITFGGLASGIDTNAIIDKLVQVERQPIDTLQQTKADQQSRKALITDLNTKFTALGDAMHPLESVSGMQGRTIGIPAGAPFAAKVNGSAPLGSYDISVTQLAQAQRTYSNSAATADTSAGLNAGTITINTGGTNAVVNVAAGDSLNTIAANINAKGLNLTAAVIYDGSQYRLVVNGQKSGAANAITFSDSGTGLGLDTGANTVVAAQDALISVDGLNAHSDTNVFTGIIPGVSLTVTAPSTRVANVPQTTALRVDNDTSTLTTALQAIVTAYNSAMGAVQAQIPTPDGSKTLGSNTLVGESVVRQAQMALMSFTTTKAGPNGNTYTTLSQIGLSVDRYGTMSLDTSKLNTALAQDPNAVTNLLTGSTGAMKVLGNVIGGFTDFVNGSFTTKSKSIDAEISAIDDKVTQLDTAATAYETNLRQQFSAMEQMISQFNSQQSSLASLLNNSNNNK